MIKALSLSQLNIVRFMFALLIMNFLAFAKIPLPYVPIVLINTAFIFWGIYFGKKMGGLLALGFLLEGVVLHLPIFAYASCGFLFFLSPTCGYVIGYVFSAYLAGYIFEKTSNLSYAFFIPSLVILSLGTLILSLWIGIKTAFIVGFVPFILPDLIKSLVFMKLHRSL